MADLLNFIGFKSISIRGRNSDFLPFTFYLFAFCLLTTVGVHAQEAGGNGEGGPYPPQNLVAPAVKSISKEEKSALDGVSDVKNRTKLALDLMEARLKKAEEFNTQEAFAALLSELGGFHALMDDAIKFLNRNDDGRGKVMNTFKRFEMSLRTFMPRIELLRRELPDNYEYHVRQLLITVRDTRSKAVEPMFTNSILPAGN